MAFRRAIRAIAVASATVTLVVLGACSLTVSTDGLSNGPLDAAVVPTPVPADATTPDDDVVIPPTDAGVDAPGVDAADARIFPSEAVVWSGNGHAYALYAVPLGVTWDEARGRAETAGGHLATLGSSAEDDFVKTLALARHDDAFNKSGVGPWLGGHQPNPTAADEPAGGWAWVDGTPWSFTDWLSLQPDNSAGIENYLDFYSPQGTLGWNDDALGGNGVPVISYIVEYE